MYRQINSMTWEEVAALDPENVICVLPIASLEQHGRALPLGTDDFTLRTAMDELPKHADLKHDFLELPQMHYGSSWEHMDFAGTVALSHTVIVAFIEDVIRAITQHGFHRLVIVNSHGGNAPIWRGLSQEWAQKFQITVYHIDFFGSDFFCGAQDILQTPVGNDIHGGEIEASYLAYAKPEVFHEDKATPENDVFVNLTDYNDGWLSKDLSPDNGLIGMASRGSAEKGRRLFEYTWKKLLSYFEEFDRI